MSSWTFPSTPGGWPWGERAYGCDLGGVVGVYFLPPSLSILLGPHLSHEAGPLGVRDVILSQVPMQPVAEVEEAVVQGQQDVSDQAWG